MHQSIFIAEDNQDDASLLTRAFKRTGLLNPLHFFDDGQKIIDNLQDLKTPHFPILILLDIKMPRLSGLEALKWIRSQTRFAHVSVVMLTSSGIDSDLQTAKTLGADSYLVKPSSFEDLIALVVGIKKHWVLVE